MQSAIARAKKDTKVGSLSLLNDMLADYHPRNFAIRLWDGSLLEAEPGEETRFTLVLRHPGALRKMFWMADEVTLGEAYIYDECDVEGDVESVFPLAEHLEKRQRPLSDRFRLARRLLSLPSNGHRMEGRGHARVSGRRHSLERDRRAVRYHYDTSNDFFALWLDQRMVYSCAYFSAADGDLDKAQEEKLEYICRKLRLRPGERLLDIGCGWGGLVIYAAEKFGVQSRGITLSEPQAELANRRIQGAGLADRCRVEVRDYREVERPGEFDKIVSVGMFEHVGESQLPAYFDRAYQLLRPGGVFLNHGIARVFNESDKRSRSFSDKYVFPDGELLPISTTVRVAEKCGFEVRDVESLREHYMLTLRNWVKRLEAHHAEAVAATDEATYRVWRLFMSGSAYRFRTGSLNLFQALLVKPDGGLSGMPLRRDDWYR